jgi:hypothetical protein
MGTRGPVPKRSEERVRRNKDDVPVESVSVIGEVEVPDLDFPDPHPMVIDFYESLKESGQAKFYEPSDWQFARFTLHFADQLLKSGRPSSQMLAAVNSALTDLLVSEGARRRVRLEVEREAAKAEVLDIASVLRERLSKPS